MARSSGGPEDILQFSVSIAVTQGQRRAVPVTQGLDFAAPQECLACGV